ncbi:MAG: hypothetical protein V1736_05565 [Pseudomonadota bacterium]
MQTIPLALCTTKMVLARDVVREDGMVLCGKGTQLTENIIDRLRRMNLSAVTVEGRPVEQQNEKTLDQELAELEDRFSLRSNDPVLMNIKRILKELIAASWQ